MNLFALDAKLDHNFRFLALYPSPIEYSFPHDSVIKLFAKLRETALSLITSNDNLKEFFNSKSILTRGLNCSTKFILEKNIFDS